MQGFFPAVKRRLAKKPGVIFFVRFILCFALFYTAISLAPQRFFEYTNHANALIAGKMLKAAGLDVTVQNQLISHTGFTAQVVGECSALFVSILPLAFFIAYPASWPWTLVGICAGLPLLFVVNLFRIVFVFMVGLNYPDLFPWVHLYLGQVGMIFAVAWICMTWLKYVNGAWDGKRSGTRLLLIALAVSIIPFVAWIWLCRPYTRVLLTIAAALLKLAGFTAVLPDTLSLYPHTFISFNIVVILGLILADRALQQTMSLAGFAKGIIVLVLLHLIFQMLPILFFQNRIIQSQWLINIFLVVHQFFLPFFFWMVLIPVPGKPDRKK